MSSVFGPVHSRRFGISLGVDLSTWGKQCNFDCLYCELSPAPAQLQQNTVTPVKSILSELIEALSDHPDIDVITLTANGEPTMYPYLNELIDAIDRIKSEKQTLILSNSACLSDDKIFHSLLKLDQVKLSLDAVTSSVFHKIDRPAEGIDIDTIVDAIRRFSKMYSGKLFIEILFVKGINDTTEEVAALNHALDTIRCDRIDIGTIDRPPAYAVEGLSFEELYALSLQFDPTLPIHIVSRMHAKAVPTSYSDSMILETLDKRPLTLDDIQALFDDDSRNRFETLLHNGKITAVERSNVFFYIPTQNLNRKRAKKTLFS